MSITEMDVLSALKDCYDPEVPVNIVDLGLIYGVKLQPDENSTPAFPRQSVAGIPEISHTEVNLVWLPAWGPERITPEGRKTLGFE